MHHKAPLTKSQPSNVDLLSFKTVLEPKAVSRMDLDSLRFSARKIPAANCRGCDAELQSNRLTGGLRVWVHVQGKVALKERSLSWGVSLCVEQMSLGV